MQELIAPMRRYLAEAEIAAEAEVTNIKDGAGLGPPLGLSLRNKAPMGPRRPARRRRGRERGGGRLGVRRGQPERSTRRSRSSARALATAVADQLSVPGATTVR